MQDLTVETLGSGRLAQVYPLIRSATRVSLERWEEFGRQLLASGGGVLAVIAPDECIMASRPIDGDATCATNNASMSKSSLLSILAETTGFARHCAVSWSELPPSSNALP